MRQTSNIVAVAVKFSPQLTGRDDLLSLIRLHKIFNDLEMGEPDIRKVSELAKQNELERLQRKVEYLENQIFVLEYQKMKVTNHLLVLNRRIDEFQGTSGNV